MTTQNLFERTSLPAIGIARKLRSTHSCFRTSLRDSFLGSSRPFQSIRTPSVPPGNRVVRAVSVNPGLDLRVSFVNSLCAKGNPTNLVLAVVLRRGKFSTFTYFQKNNTRDDIPPPWVSAAALAASSPSSCWPLRDICCGISWEGQNR